MVMNKIIVLFLFGLIGFASFAQEIKEEKKVDTKKVDITNRPFGKGIINYTASDDSWSTKMTLRFQALYSVGNNVAPNFGFTDGYSNFMIRRARLKFSGHAFSPKLKYKMELGQSSRDIGGFVDEEHKGAPGLVFDAVVFWNFAEGFNLWVGQTKLPGNRERVVSSANLQLVDRSLLNGNFNIDRDIGVQLHHKWSIGDPMTSFVMKEKFSVSQGEGRGITIDNIGGFSYTGRIELLPFGEFDKKGKDDYVGSSLKRPQTSKFVFAFGGDFNDGASRTHASRGKFMDNDSERGYYITNISTLFIDLAYKYKGWSLMSEYASRNAEDAIAKNTDGTETGQYVMEGKSFNVMGGYLFSNNWEVTGRMTTVDYKDTYTLNNGSTDVKQYTLGVSKYLAGHNLKVQADVSYKETNGKDDGLLGRIQLELQF